MSEKDAGQALSEIPHFAVTLDKNGLALARTGAHTLQVNVGYICNMACKHCHLDAGPTRREIMSAATMAEVIALARRVPFQVIDITGGAPELVPRIELFIEELRPLAGKLIFRSNLTALSGPGGDGLLALLKRNRLAIVASLPAANAAQLEAQRGSGVFAVCISMLQRLNDEGFGQEGSGLELDIVANPTGAFLPVSQCRAEEKFKQDLAQKWGIVFNHLYTFANVPLGRFQKWLLTSGNYEQYMRRLFENFNPATIHGLMCRSQISVSWDGYLADCDFHLAAGLYLGGGKRHVSEFAAAPAVGTPILTGDHCYACTAGSGFT